MAWIDDVRQAFVALGGVAHLSQLYDQIEIQRPDLSNTWKNTVRRTIEQHSSDSIAFAGTDVFEAVGGLGDGVWSLRDDQGLTVGGNLQVGVEYTKDSIEREFETDFGDRIKGITQRRDPNTNVAYILLFSREDGPYGDSFSSDTFYFLGEGLVGDQQLTPANKALKEAPRKRTPIFGFRQDSGDENWRFLGTLEVADYEYVEHSDRKVYEFHVKRVGSDIWPIADYRDWLAEPQLTEQYGDQTAVRKQRSESFSKVVKSLYLQRCVVCGLKRLSRSGAAEVEAAHIFPVEKNGSSDPRNGIALCKLHHWSFDRGLVSIGPDMHVLVHSSLGDTRDYHEITRYRDREALRPQISLLAPHQLFLDQHRRYHGF